MTIGRVLFLGIIFLVFTFLGCSTSPDPTRKDLATAAQLATDQKVPESLQPYYQRLYWEGESQATLNRMRLASAAIEEGEWKDAEHALDEVIGEIETLGPANERSREALSKFKAEDIKKFKGEPYERAMAYLLRGLLYLRIHAWDNARACFKSVQIQDAAKNDPALRGNWASAHWLEGWCNWNLGDLSEAKECWDRIDRQVSNNTPLPLPTKNDQVLCVLLLGSSPIKIPGGDYGEHLSYRQGNSKVIQAKLNLDKKPRVVPLAEDLFAQAASRGLRRMDTVNEGKADTRAGTATAGDILTTGGVGATLGGAVANDRDVAAIGLGVTAAGLATKGVASTIQPKADTRTWDLLPATIHLLPLTLPANKQILEFQFLDQQGNIVRKRTVKIDVNQQPQLILLIER